MIPISNDHIRGFVNALQLCISSQIMSWQGPHYRSSDNLFVINFGPWDPDDSNLEKFQKIVPGRWVTSEFKKRIYSYFIQNLDQIDLSLLTNFLLLTRLQDDQIVSLASQDARFRPFEEALGLASKEAAKPIVALADIRDVVFKTIGQKNMSLKTVAELTGISQVSLSNFKAGNDIRISTLLKIAKALGVKLTLG